MTEPDFDFDDTSSLQEEMKRALVERYGEDVLLYIPAKKRSAMNLPRITPDERSVPKEVLEYHILCSRPGMRFKVVSADWAHTLKFCDEEAHDLGISILGITQVVTTTTEVNLAHTLHDWRVANISGGHFPL